MPLSDRFEDALVFASRLHSQQVRKGSTIPYVSHLLGVASIVLEHGGDEDEAIAALLHDAVEDQGGAGTRAEILARFGPRVAAIVDGCTDADAIPKPPWQERKRAYLEKVAGADSSVRLVSAADKLHNVRSLLNDYRQLGEALWSRFSGGREGTLWYYRALVDTYLVADTSPLLAELAARVSELERLASRSQ